MIYSEYSDPEICASKIFNKSTFYDRVKTAAMFELSKQVYGLNISNKRLSGTEIWDATQRNFANLHDSHGDSFFPDQQRDTFIQYLSKHVRDPESPINSDGQRKGFYIDNGKIQLMPGNDITKCITNSCPPVINDDAIKCRTARESTLYAVLQSWLVTNGYQAADISNYKSGNRWGNPDLAGIRTFESFQGISMEVATIEAKASSKDWMVQIFETVSHLRFANRAYFAYAETKSR